jgi:hypothetical protein
MKSRGNAPSFFRFTPSSRECSGQIAPSTLNSSLNKKFPNLPRAFSRLPRAQAKARGNLPRGEKYFSSGLLDPLGDLQETCNSSSVNHHSSFPNSISETRRETRRFQGGTQDPGRPGTFWFLYVSLRWSYGTLNDD